MAAISQLSPFKSWHEVFFEKAFPEQTEWEETAATMRGHIKEPMLVRWYEATTGRSVRVDDKTVQHPEHPLVTATPDGYVDPDGLIECKAPGRYTIHHWGENGTDEIPEYYIPQGMWQMAATGRHWVDFAVDLGDELGVYRLNYNHDFFLSLLNIVERFWNDYVLPKIPPPPDYSDGCAETLLKLHPSQMKEPLDRPDEETQGLMTRYRQANENLREAQREEKLVKNMLKTRIGDNRGFEDMDGNKVIWFQVKGRAKTDWEAIAKELGADEESIARHTTIGRPSRSMRGYWKGRQ